MRPSTTSHLNVSRESADSACEPTWTGLITSPDTLPLCSYEPFEIRIDHR